MRVARPALSRFTTSTCCILSCLFCFLPLLSSRASASEADDVLYESAFEARVIDSQPDSCTVELLNTNDSPPRESQARVIVNRWLAVPERAIVSYELLEAEWSTYWPEETVGPMRATTPDEIKNLPSGLRSITGEYVGVFRSVGLARMRLSVTTSAPPDSTRSARGITFLQRAVIKATISGTSLEEPATPENMAERDPYALEFLQDIVVNPEQVPQFSREVDGLANVSELQQWQDTLGQAKAEGGFARKIHVTNSGIYSLNARDFRRNEIDPGSVYPDRLHLFVGNQEVPLRRQDKKRGVLDLNETLTCYITAESEPRYPYTPVWLLQFPEEANATAPPTWETVEINRGPLQRDEGISLTARHFIFEPAHFDKRYGESSRTGNWALSECPRGQFVRLPFTLETVDTATSGSLDMEFGGYYGNHRRYAEVFINGVQLGGRESFPGAGPNPRTYTVPAGVLKAGRNVLTVHYPEVKEERLDDKLAIYWAELQYPIDPLDFPLQTPVAITGPENAIVDLRANRPEASYQTQPFFLDVSDPFAPKTYGGYNTRGVTGRMAFATRITLSSQDLTITYADSDSTRSFGRFIPAAPTDLLAPEEGADYLVIAHPELLYAVHELGQTRQLEGKRIRLVSVDDVYNTFGYGTKDYLPIKDFLHHAFTAWPGKRLTQVLLVGEASEFWWEERQPRSDVSPNMIPIYGYGEPGIAIRGDDGYAQIAGEDMFADLEIGRISAATGEEVLAYTRRIFDYEKNPPAGPWINRHVFFSDDEPEFARVANRIIETQLDQAGEPERHFLQEYPYEDYFRIFARKRSPAMTDAIVDAMSRGALTATYFGHGGPNLWSAERIFHYRDIPAIELRGGRPIMAAASCDTAWVDYPIAPVRQSIGEQFILAENGGGIALFAPVAGTSSYEHDFLLRPFYEALLKKKFAELGRASLYAKVQYLLTRNQRYVPDQFILLGDPALKIPRPSENLSLLIEPSELFTNQGDSLKINGTSPRTDWGVAQVEMFNKEGISVAGPLRGPVQAGKFALELPLPPFVPKGDYRLLIQAWNEGLGVFDSLNVEIPVLEPKVDLAWTMTPDASTGIDAGETVTMELRALNRGEGYMDNLVLTLRDAAQGKDLRDSRLILEPGQERTVRFAFPAPAGINRLEARVEYANAAAGMLPIAEEAIEFLALDPALPVVAASAQLVDVERLAAPEQTTFTIPLYNMRSASLDNLSAALLLMDTEEGTPVGTRLGRLSIEPGESTDLEFRATTRFPAQPLRFRVDVEGTITESNEPFAQSLDLLIDIPGGQDLYVVPGSTRTERDDYVKGETVYVRATIGNRGARPVSGLRTTLYLDFPWDPDSKAKSIVDESEIVFDTPLEPGEERDVRLRWDPVDSSNLNVRLYVVTNSDRAIPEATFQNNVGDVTVPLMRLPNLALDKELIEPKPKFVRPGDVVAVDIPYRNDSPFDFAHPFVIHIAAQGGGKPEDLIHRSTLERLDSGEEGLVQIAWRADGIRDTIHISLNDDRDYGEQEVNDNVADLPLTHVINEKYLRTSTGDWDFQPTYRYGVLKSLSHAPDDTLILKEYPEQETRIAFSNEYVIGDPLPEDVFRHEQDNRMSIVDGTLIWTVYEMPGEVRFRLPMPTDDGTTLYDVSFQQFGTSTVSGVPVNRYRYALEDDPDWKVMSDLSNSTAYAARVETRDDYLDLSISPRGIPSNNSIFGVVVVPLSGSFESPAYEVSELPAARFEAQFEAPGYSHVEFAFRIGYGTIDDPEFDPWYPIENGNLIKADPYAHFIQWRASLGGDGTNLPALGNVRLVFPKDSRKIAEAPR
ncbi:MAG: hypothetical protein PWP23_194 [Candidatus Sumerlaeota bacterium]|nr:hypothetical protein [Candidatus Sumerlaeota bacterium]